MTPSMQYDVEAALKEMLEAPSELTWRSLEETLKRNGLRLVKEAEEVTEADVDAAFVRGVEHVLYLAREAETGEIRAGKIRRAGTEAPEFCLTTAELSEIVEGAFTE